MAAKTAKVTRTPPRKKRRTVKDEGSLSVAQQAHLESNTVSNILARKLNDAIIRGEFAVGGALPSERDLMSQYNLSRATVREALRVLSARDLIEVRRGRSGGSFISIPSSHSVIRSLSQFIAGQNFRYIDLITVRAALEPAAAAQAAASRTEEKLEALRRCSEECEASVGDIDRFVVANLKWHLALVEASGNPLLLAFSTSIANAMHSATAFEEFDLPTRMSVVGVHWNIFKAIRAQDPEAARRRTLRHLTAYEDKLTAISEEGKSK